MKMIKILACLTMLVGMPSAATVSHAQTAVTSPKVFSVNAQLASSTVMASEPMRVAISFTGTVDRPVSVYVGEDLRWCTFEVVQDNKVLATWNQNVRSALFSGISPGETLILPSEKVYSVLLPSRLTDLPQGQYTLRLRTTIRRANTDRRVERMERSTPSVTQEDVTSVEFTVQPLDEEQMKDRIGKIYRAIGREQDINAVQQMSRELATMPAEQAKGAWRSLLLDKKIPAQTRYQIARALSTQPTRLMIETMLYVQYTDPIRDDAGNMITLKDMIHGMAQFNGSKEVYEYVESEFKRHSKSPFDSQLLMDHGIQ